MSRVWLRVQGPRYLFFWYCATNSWQTCFGNPVMGNKLRFHFTKIASDSGCFLKMRNPNLAT